MSRPLKRSEIIIVSLVHRHILMSKGGEYSVQIAGVSDNPRKIMQLQAWTIPHATIEEARKMRNDFIERAKEGKGSFLLIKK